MKIIKRNGAEVPFDITKIITAVTKASDSVSGQSRLTKDQITQIAAVVTDQCQALNRAVSVEEVPGHIMCLDVHELVLHHILHFFHADGAVQRLTLVGNSSGDLGYLVLG